MKWAIAPFTGLGGHFDQADTWEPTIQPKGTALTGRLSNFFPNCRRSARLEAIRAIAPLRQIHSRVNRAARRRLIEAPERRHLPESIGT